MSDIYNTGNPKDVFELTECIGSGAYGSVYRAKDKETGQIWAVKKLQFDDPSEVEEIEKEIVMLKECDSPSIVGYRGSWRETETCVWIAMEMCEEGSILSALEATKHGLNDEQLSFVLRQTLIGLAYLHHNHKIHRDLKAGNLLLTAQGDVKIADFGVSASVQRTIDKRNTVIGSPYWMAPEVLQEKGYDFHADIWSLGITAIEMVDTKPPLAEVHAFRAVFQIPKNPPPTLRHKEKYSAEMNDFISCCLKKDPAERWTCDQLLEHPYIKKYASSDHSCILPLIREVAVAKQKIKDQKEALARKLEAAQQEQSAPKHKPKQEEEEEDEEDEEGEEGYSTMVPKQKAKPAAPAEEEDEDSEEGYGTMVVNKPKPKPQPEQEPKKKQEEEESEWEEYDEEDEEEEEQNDSTMVMTPAALKAKMAAMKAQKQ